MKSIAVVVPELLPVPPVQGGAIEHWVHEVTGRMSSQGRRLAVVSRPAGQPGRPDVQYIGIPWTHAERWFHRIKEKSRRVNPLRHLAKIQNVWSYGRRVAQTVGRFDVVYLHNEPNVLLFLKKARGQRIVLHMHNDHLSMPLFRPLYRRALAKTDVVLCVSDYIRRRAIERFPEYADRFRVVLNATDANEFKPYEDLAFTALAGKIKFDGACRYLLYVGRLTRIKGVHVLIAAFRQVLERQPNTRLIIAGSSFFEGAGRTSYEEELVNLAASARDAIVFTGFLPHVTLKYLYSAADMVVVPSVWQDPCPLVVFEAMSSGTLVVASAVGGVPEIIQNQHTGVLVRPDDPAALAAAIENMLGDAEKKEKIEQSAREKVLVDYTWERLVTQVEAALGGLQ